MKPNARKAFIILIAITLIGYADSTFESYKCTAGDGNNCKDGSEPTVMCNTASGGNCPVICAAECGSMTGCIVGDCESCCSAGTCSKYTSGSDEFDACVKSCAGNCAANKEFCEIILILESIAAGLAVLSLMVNGLKWMTADDFQGRDDAKKGVYYVLVGLALVIISFALVNYLYVGEVSCPI
ncbi:MAG: hypothetical protein JW778_01065 [Candidatus Altiarchaeota archaeon]|nr:hypothetical protein [Candidatus Altiarchaeota archaeon]